MQSFSERDEVLLRRALLLAKRAAPPVVEPNPRVGAVIAIGERILGEGYHREYGGPHAEVEALQQVRERSFLAQATLYVTLEPCCHQNKKTPPCVPQIIQMGIPRVVVGTIDPNPAVSGKGIALLKEAGVEVVLAPDPIPYRRVLQHFWVNMQERRPYITLKWAQTSGHFPFGGGIIGSRTQGKWPITGFTGKVWAHRLRAQHSHIAVGYRTWLLDQPQLTTRYFPGSSPKPLVLYDAKRPLPFPAPSFFHPYEAITQDWLSELYEKHKVGSILVEGGAALLEQFLKSGYYDEVHAIVSNANQLPPPESAVMAPSLPPMAWQSLRLSTQEEVWIGRKYSTLLVPGHTHTI
ncbi:MAG: bifunctional diaminohydroxyphosphoribosylaminopyrimidine deaminase/5-amino-6-(5-phosphoribosylamino)uracil reductase RibD [Bacteroidia bacterium]|nr:bifunctional diaminohydroxyphosphoribosylaminopyrimidine deaminase/5-amino-6-(5-phosphoribosylamino)uracil reductase RibD [Bacteroidia bacterium]MDW8235116.1 bifunctional diaminohydroxyphosphoribosylaminopyrimidine deaminase/5-amino-6-(5-phosphoribosylamino)uracil reductase RibD [Bacteroidia bacterium]